MTIAAFRGALAAFSLHPVMWAAIGLNTAVFSCWMLGAAGHLSAAAILQLLVFSLSSVYLGGSILRLLPGFPNPRVALSRTLLVGYLTFGCILFLLEVLTSLHIQYNCLIVFLLSLGLHWVAVRSSGQTPDFEAKEFYFLVLVCTAASLWSQDLFGHLRSIEGAVVFRPYSEYFFHAAQVARFTAQENPLRLGNYDLVDTPVNFYHYLSYVFPAALSGATGMTAYASLSALWVPFGLYLAGLSASTLIGSFYGLRAGACAAAGVLLFPDASFYGVRILLFAYHTVNQFGPGKLYGLATAALSVHFAHSAIQHRSARFAVAALIASGVCLLMKAQIFVVLLPLNLAYMILFYPDIARRRRAILLLAVVSVGVAGIWAKNLLGIGPRIDPSGTAAAPFYSSLVLGMSEGALRDLFGSVSRQDSLALFYVAYVVLLLVSTFGLWLVVYAGALAYLYRKRALSNVDALPLLAVGLYLAAALVLPRSDYGNRFELVHRHFVWAYFLLVTVPLGRLAASLGETRLGQTRLTRSLLLVAGAGLFAVPLVFGQGVQQRAPELLRKRVNVGIDEGFVSCAAHLRRNTSTADVVQDSRNDPRMILAGLSERRAYLARERVHRRMVLHARAVLNERRDWMRGLRKASDWKEARRIGQRTGIRWYVLRPGDDAAWTRRSEVVPVFVSGDCRIYDLGAEES